MLGSVPKLLPLWNGVTVKDVQSCVPLKNGIVRCDRVCLDSNLFPDHGGAGVDMILKDSVVECEILKSATNSSNYGSEMCALPFLPPNKVKFHRDPCLGTLCQRRKKENQFCLSLQACRKQANLHRHFRSKIFSSLNEMPDLVKNGKFDDIFVPKSIVKLAKLFPKKFPCPVAKWDYRGGCMSLYSQDPSSGSPSYLLHPVGPKLNQLAITPIEEKSNGSQIIEAQIKNQRKIYPKSGKIVQIVENSNTGMCGIRNKRKYHYINLYDMNKRKSKLPMESFRLEEKLSDFKLSPYVPGEHIVATASGMLFLENAELRKRLWQLDEHLIHDALVQDMCWWCDFGAHPRCVLYSDRQSFCSLDLRSKKAKAQSIFSSPNPFLIGGEQLAVTRRFTNVHFQHLVATDSQLFICDERYPQQPLISWSHMLRSVPLYCDIRQLNHKCSPEYVILLASQESADVASFQVGSTSRIQPISLSLPLHLSKPRDCTDILKLHNGLIEDEITERLTMSLMGVCSVPHSFDDGYTVLQMTSFGDVFYQTFQSKGVDSYENPNQIRPGFTLAPEKVFPNLSTWTESVKIKSKVKAKKIPSFKVNRQKILKCVGKLVPSNKCSVCKSSDDAEKFCDADVCPRCGLHVEFQQHLLKCAENKGLLCGELQCGEGSSHSPPLIPLVDTSKYLDPCSQSILNTWVDDEELSFSDLPEAAPSQSQFGDYNTTPSLIFPIHAESQRTNTSGNLFVSSQQFCFDEDVIPPTQEIGSQSFLYSRKMSQGIRHNTTVAF